MIELIKGIALGTAQGGGGGGGQTINNEDLTITANGEYTAGEGYTGIGTATVNVPQYEERTVTNTTGSAIAKDDKVWVDGSNLTSYYDMANPNFSLVGSPTVTNGVASGFSTSNYITPKCAFQNAYSLTSTWEWRTKTRLTTLDVFSPIFGGEAGTYLPDLFVGTTNRIGMNLSSNGTAYNICELAMGTTNLSTNTDYWVKWGWTGTVYYIDISTDGINYTREVSVNSTSPIYSYDYSHRPLRIGFRVGEYFRGGIDLKETKLSINGASFSYTWQGYNVLTTADTNTGVALEAISNNASGKVGIGELGKKYGATINNFLGDVDANGKLQAPNFPLELVFNGVISITDQYALVLPKYHGTQNTVKSASFPDLETISGANSFSAPFSQTGIESISFQKLKTISGNYSCQSLCNGSSSGISEGNGKGLKSVTFPCLESVSGNNALAFAFNENSNLTSCSFPSLKTWDGGSSTLFQNTGIEQTEMPELEEISTNYFYVYKNAKKLKTATFPKLKTISSFALNGSFEGCSSLESVSFGGLLSSSFSSPYAYFTNMLKNLSNVTVHFPSNLQAVIGSWSDVTNGFGGTNTTVLYDLPATE